VNQIKLWWLVSPFLLLDGQIHVQLAAQTPSPIVLWFNKPQMRKYPTVLAAFKKWSKSNHMHMLVFSVEVRILYRDCMIRFSIMLV
jgi:hypothetical protein